MPGFSTGSVYVKVRPDLRGWHGLIAQQAKEPSERAGKDLADKIGKPIRERMEKVLADGIKAGRSGYTTAARRAGADGGDAFAGGLKGRITAALRNLPKIELDADTSEADGRIAELTDRLEHLADQKIGVDIDAGEARRQVGEIRHELEELSRHEPRLDVRVDAGAAAAQLAAFNAEVERLDGKEIDVKVSDRSFLSASTFQSHIRKIISAVATFSPAIVAATATAAAGLTGLLGPLGAAGAGIGVFGIALAGNVIAAAKAQVEIGKLEKELSETADAARQLEIMAEIGTLMAKMSPQARTFAGQVEQLGMSWRNFMNATRTPTLTVAGHALEILQRALLPLPQIVNAVRPAMAGFLNRIDGFVSGAGYATFLGFIRAEAPRALGNLTRLMAGLATGIGGVVMAFTPFGQTFLKVLADGAERFASWGQQLGSTSGFRAFIDYVKSVGPTLLSTIGSIVNAIVQVGQAIAPLGGPMLSIIGGLANALALVANVAPGLVGVIAALYAVKQVISAFGPAVLAAKDRFIGFAGATKSAVGSMSGLKAAGGSLFGAIGGPWGVAVALGVTALGLFADAHAETEQSTNELKAALDRETGAITKNARQLAIKKLVDTGAAKAAREVGIPNEQLIGAYLGNADALGAVNSRLKEVHKSRLEENKGLVGASRHQQGQLTAYKLLKSVIGSSNNAIREERDLIAQAARLKGGYQGEVKGLTFATLEELKAHREVGAAIRERRNALAALIEQQRKSRQESLALANAELGYEQALLDVKQSIVDNGKTHKANTQAGIDNRRSLHGLAAANHAVGDSAKFIAKPMKAQIAILKQQRTDFIAAAIAMGYSDKQAIALADSLLKIPKHVRTKARLDAEKKKLKDWTTDVDYLKKARTTKAKVAADRRALTDWVNRLNKGTKDRRTGLSADANKRGINVFLKGLGTVPPTQSTDLKGRPQRRGVNVFQGMLNSLPRNRPTLLTARPITSGIARFKAALNSIDKTVTIAVRTATALGSAGGVVRPDGLIGYASGGAVDLRRGGSLRGYSRDDDTIAMLRSGEGVLVPEVVKGLGGPSTIKALNAAGNQIVEVLRKVLGIASPSKVMRDLGKWIVAGLVKGLTGSVDRVESTVRSLGERVYNAFTKQFGVTKGRSRSSALMRNLADENKRIRSLAVQREKMAERIKAAQDKLADAVRAREDFSRQIRESVVGFGSITGLAPSGEPPNAFSMIESLRGKVAEAGTFATTLARLRKSGLNKTTYRQLVEAGVEGGGPLAQALLEGGTGAIKQINVLTGKLGATAKSLGTTSSRELYQAGVNAAAGFVKGLQSAQAKLGRVAKALATYMLKYLKRALRIKSPSRAMADEIGRFLPLGIAAGIESEGHRVEQALLAPLAAVYRRPPSGPHQIPVPAGPSSGAGPRQPVYLVLDDGTRFSAYIDSRADGRLTAAAQRARSGIRR